MSNLDLLFIFMYFFLLNLCLHFRQKQGVFLVLVVLFSHTLFLVVPWPTVAQTLPVSSTNLGLLLTCLVYGAALLLLPLDSLLYLVLYALLGTVVTRLLFLDNLSDKVAVALYILLILYCVKLAVTKVLPKKLTTNLVILVSVLGGLFWFTTKSTVAAAQTIEVLNNVNTVLPNTVKREYVQANYKNLVDALIRELGLATSSFSVAVDTSPTKSENPFANEVYVLGTKLGFVLCNSKITVANNMTCDFSVVSAITPAYLLPLTDPGGEDVIGVVKDGPRKIFYIPLNYLLSNSKYDILKSGLRKVIVIEAPAELQAITKPSMADFYVISSILLLYIVLNNLTGFWVKTSALQKIRNLSLAKVLVLILCTVVISSTSIIIRAKLQKTVITAKTDLFNKDKSFYYKDFLLYDPKFSQIENLNYSKFSPNYLTKSFALRTKAFKDMTRLVLTNKTIFNLYLTTTNSNYLFFDYVHTKISKVQLDLLCSDPLGNLILYPEPKQLAMEVGYINEFGEATLETERLFKHPGCLDPLKVVSIELPINRVLFNHEQGSVVGLTGIAPAEIKTITFLDQADRPIPNTYLAYVAGVDYKSFTSSQEPLYSFSTNKEKRKFNWEPTLRYDEATLKKTLVKFITTLDHDN